MIRLVPVLVVWVDGVGHVGGEVEALSNASEVLLLPALPLRRQSAEDSLREFAEQVGVGALSGLGTDFFVVEEHENAHVSGVGAGRVVKQGV
mmetsp:Transcript_4968/g.3583  ORF Transcript_4968/g.3583 Transcript_4968/m.3583 type:complete len:92 (-) Transcript_4968:846-1121(-)